ncbi:MAG TPA: hypothetical protein VF069_24365 [Streptosporangiaceae bacterium]
MTATAGWAAFLPAHVLLAGRRPAGPWWGWRMVAAMPPAILVAVPLLLLALSPLARPVRRWLPPLLALMVVIGVTLGLYGHGRARTSPSAGTPAGAYVAR